MSDETEFGSRIVEAEKRLNDEHFDAMRAVAAAADLKTENAAQRVRIAELEKALDDIAEFTFCKPGFRCDRCNDTRRKALAALKESSE